MRTPVVSERSKQPAGPRIMSADGVRVGESIGGPLGLPLAKATVTQCRVDHAFSLLLDEVDAVARVWTVRIEGPFSLTNGDQHTTVFDGEAPPSAWGPAIDALLHETLLDATVTEAGTLSLRFETGYRLEATALHQYDAWQVSGPGGFLAVCEPGGRVSRWASQPW